MARKSKTLKPNHSLPGDLWLDYILLPYGEFYRATLPFASAKKGDIMRFFNGPEVVVEKVIKIRQDEFCDMLCRIRYGIPWANAFKRWQSYAVLEGNDRNVLSNEYCLWVIYDRDKSEICR